MMTTKDTIERNYKRGLWTKEMLVKLVVKGKLSASDYSNIVEDDVPLENLTSEEIQKVLTNAVQTYMDETVQARGYDNIHTACSYVNSTDEIFAREGKACVVWRDSVWRMCYNILADVKLGIRNIPTVDELLTELPVLEWDII